MSKKFLLVFILILIIAAFLRFYRITDIPPGVNRDEASIGYTAYSLLHTGSDEYARVFPLSFQSFGDWKLPLYIYTVVPFVSIFGLSELAVRLPSAIFGILSVTLTFYLVKILFKNKILAFITMFLTAISPWSIHLSRVESESNTAVFLTLLAVICFFKSMEGKKWLIIPSLVCFSATYFTYAGNYIFTTLLIIGIFIIYGKTIPKTKHLFISIAIFLLVSGFIWLNTFSANQTKVSGISIFGDPAVVHSKIEIPRNEHDNPKSFFTKAMHNKVIYGAEKIAQNYLNSFSPEFLFVRGGGNNSHNIVNFGNMYLIEAPFLFLGLIYLFVIKKGRERNVILLWFFIAPIAASITKDAPHTNRMFSIFPILSLTSAFGIYWLLIEIIRKKLFKKMFIGLLIASFIVNVLMYMDRYFVHFPRNEAVNWGIGYRALNELLTSSSFSSKKVIMARPKYSPYIYLLFYSKYDPALYQKEAVRYPPTQDGFVDVKAFGRYEFRDIDWNRDLQQDVVLVTWSSQVPEPIKASYKTQEITLVNGESMFTVIRAK